MTGTDVLAETVLQGWLQDGRLEDVEGRWLHMPRLQVADVADLAVSVPGKKWGEVTTLQRVRLRITVDSKTCWEGRVARAPQGVVITPRRTGIAVPTGSVFLPNISRKSRDRVVLSSVNKMKLANNMFRVKKFLAAHLPEQHKYSNGTGADLDSLLLGSKTETDEDTGSGSG